MRYFRPKRTDGIRPERTLSYAFVSPMPITRAASATVNVCFSISSAFLRFSKESPAELANTSS